MKRESLGVVALASVLTLVLFVYPLVLGTPLLDPDEGIHAAIAQEMVERGDWVVPRLLDEPFLDKPILYFWAEALSLRLFGMHEAAVRLPGLLFGWLGALTTAVVGWRMFGRTIGVIAGLFYGTMILPTALAQAAAHDVALVPWVNLALLLFWESQHTTSRRRVVLNTLGIGLLLGLACLTKGLVGVALVGTAWGCYLILSRRLSIAACLQGVAVLALAALVAAPWYLAFEARSPGYLYYFFVERHLLGFATSTQNHGSAPWWYYLPILLGGGLPWIGYLPVTILDGIARRREARGDQKGTVPFSRRNGTLQEDAPVPPRKSGQSPSGGRDGALLLLGCWIVACTLLLSLSHSKLVTYIWPVFPAVALLAAVAWARLIEGRLSEGARRCFAQTLLSSSAGGILLMPIAMLVVQEEFSIRFAWPVWLAVGVVAISSPLPALLWLKGHPKATLAGGTLSLALHFAFIMTWIVPQVATTTSAGDLATHYNGLGELPTQLWVAEERLGSFIFYLDPQLRAGLREGQLQYVRFAELPTMKPGVVIALPENEVDWADRHIDLDGLVYDSVGRYRVYHGTQFDPRPPLTASESQPVLR